MREGIPIALINCKKNKAKFDVVRKISCPMSISMTNIFDNIRSLKSDYGKPWMAEEIRFSNGPAIIIGPHKGTYIYICKGKSEKNIYISINTNMDYIVIDEGRRNILLNEDNKYIEVDNRQIQFEYICVVDLVNHIADLIEKYIRNNEQNTNIEYKNIDKVLMFSSDVLARDRIFSMYDIEGTPQFEVAGMNAYQNFVISNSLSGEPIIRAYRSIFSLIPHYVIYEHGNVIGELKKKVAFLSTNYYINTQFGCVSLKSTMDKEEYNVDVNNSTVGKISYGYHSLSQGNNNKGYLIIIKDAKYELLMVLMGVMVVGIKTKFY